MQYLELAEGYLLSNKMDVKLDVLSPPMMHRVFRQVNRRYIVAVDDRG